MRQFPAVTVKSRKHNPFTKIAVSVKKVLQHSRARSLINARHILSFPSNGGAKVETSLHVFALIIYADRHIYILNRFLISEGYNDRKVMQKFAIPDIFMRCLYCSGNCGNVERLLASEGKQHHDKF